MKQKNKVLNILSLILIFIFAMNSGLILLSQVHYAYIKDKEINTNLKEFKEYSKNKKKINIRLKHHGIQGIEYNLDDKNLNNYNLVEDESLEKEGYYFYY